MTIKEILTKRFLLITEHFRNLYKHKRTFDIAVIVLLLSLVFISRLSMFGTTTSKVWWNLDDADYISVANSLSHGHGFNLNFLEYNEVIANTPNGAVYQYSLYNTVGRPYSFAGPIYPLFLAGIFIISSASPSNWYTVAAIANMVVTMLIVVAIFVFSPKTV